MRSIGTDSGAKRFLPYLVTIFSITSLAVVGQDITTKPLSWSGILVSSSCNADEAFAESQDCMKDVPGAKLALYDDTNRVMYNLEPQASVTSRLGDTVTLRGTLDDDTIHITSLELMSIGLAVSEKAPAFLLRDQLGRAQTLDTLKGTNGTVLLFFRSADW
jgi:hypothetical protein